MGRPAVDPCVRFWRFVQQTEGCWLWRGHTNHGYGHFNAGPGQHWVYAHVFAYEQEHGPVPVGLCLDHLCRVRRCVRPEHLEPVPLRVNILRGVGWAARNARKDRCNQGHAFDEGNTYVNPQGERICRVCQRQANRRYYRKCHAL